MLISYEERDMYNLLTDSEVALVSMNRIMHILGELDKEGKISDEQRERIGAELPYLRKLVHTVGELKK